MYPLKKMVKKVEEQVREDNREWFEGFLEKNYPGCLKRRRKGEIRIPIPNQTEQQEQAVQEIKVILEKTTKSEE